MPTFEFTSPDGKTYSVEGPPGSTADQAFAILQQHGAAATSAQTTTESAQPQKLDINHRSPLAPLEDFFSEGISFGMMDELSSSIGAAIRAPFSKKTYGEIYDQLREQQLRDLAKDRAQHPILSGLGMVAGTIMPSGDALKLGKVVLAKAPAWVRLGATGAAEGAAYGAGTAEGGNRKLSDLVTNHVPESRLKGAENGAAWGIIGSAIPTVAGAALKLAAPAARTAIRTIFANTPKNQAQRIVSQALESEGLTTEEAQAKLAELGPQARLADIIPRTARAAAAIPKGGAHQVAKDFLEQRQAGQRSRLLDVAGLGKVPEFKKAFTSFMNQRQSQAKPLYDEAYAAPVDLTSPQMQALLSRPQVAAAVRKGAIKLRNEGGGSGHVALLDAAKRVLDDQIGKALRNGERDAARVLIGNKQALVAEVDRQVPAFAKARSIYAGEAATHDAAELGRNTLTKPRTDLDNVALAVEGMGQGEKTAFQMGALRGLLDRLEGTADNRNAAQKLIESPRAREVLELAFPDKASLARLIQTAESESLFSKTKNMVTGGSPTARIQEDTANLKEGAGIVSALAKGDVVKATGHLLKKLGMGKVSNETLGELGKILFNQTPKQLAKSELAPPTPPPKLIQQAQRLLPNRETVGAAIGANAGSSQ